MTSIVLDNSNHVVGRCVIPIPPLRSVPLYLSVKWQKTTLNQKASDSSHWCGAGYHHHRSQRNISVSFSLCFVFLSEERCPCTDWERGNVWLGHSVVDCPPTNNSTNVHLVNDWSSVTDPDLESLYSYNVREFSLLTFETPWHLCLWFVGLLRGTADVLRHSDSFISRVRRYSTVLLS